MKTIQYITMIVLGAVMFLSCGEQDEFGLESEQSEPGINFRMIRDITSFNLFEPDEVITLTTYTETASDIDNVSVVVDYLSVAPGSNVSDRAVIATLQGNQLTNDGSVQLTTSLQEAATALGLDVANIEGGDIFTLYNIVTTTSGAVYPDTVMLNGNPFLNVENAFVTASESVSFTTNLSFPITCPSDPADWEGTYDAVITTSGGSFGPIFTGNSNVVTISFTGPEPFRYTVSDMSAASYVAFGGSEYPGDIFDICGVPKAQNVNTFGLTTDTGGGTRDPATGVITLNYVETGNNITWTIVFTPQ